MSFRSIRSHLLVAVVTYFLCTWLMSWSCVTDGGREKTRVEREAKTETLALQSTPTHPKQWTFLLVAVLSAPGDSAVRQVIRGTWMRLSAKGKETVSVIFTMGTLGLDSVTLSRLEEEQSLNGDLALIPTLQASCLFLQQNHCEMGAGVPSQHRKGEVPVRPLYLDGWRWRVNSHVHSEHYSNLTRKTLATMVYAHDHFQFDFLMKADSDSFIRLGALLKSLKDVAHPRLYWGFLDGRAKPIRKGKWKESDWILCDRYLPYQLGGGYVLSASLVSFLSSSAPLLKMYKNEDVAVGAWLAGLDVKYVHDPRFDTEFRSRGCSNQYLVTHKKSPGEMMTLYNNVLSTQLLCEKEFRVRGSYVYDWSGPPSLCCQRSNTSGIPQRGIDSLLGLFISHVCDFS